MPDRTRLIMRAGHYVVLPPRSADQLFLMLLCLFSSLGILLGGAPAPGTIEANMPEWMVLVWAFILGGGALIVIVSYLKKDRIDAIIWEQFGSICLAAASLLYGTLVVAMQWKTGGTIPGVLILGFCLTRAYQAKYYQKVLKNVHEVMQLSEEIEEEAGDPDGNER